MGRQTTGVADTLASGMALTALFGIENEGFGIAANLLVIFLIAIWLALVFWAYNDAKRRVDDPVLIGAAAFAALIFPFAGALVYAIVRPPETIDDRYERELDIRAGELRVRMLEAAAKGGAGSAAFKTAVGGELAGEPGATRRAGSRGGESKAPPRDAPGSRGGQPAQKTAGQKTAAQKTAAQKPAAQKPADRTPAATARQERAAERSTQRTSERPAPARPSKAARPPAEEPQRRPTA